MRTFLVAVVLVQFVQLVPAAPTGYARYSDHTTFDGHFSKYSKRYFGVGFDWHYFKAQAVAESNLRPDATSAVDARGVMQIMPRTFEEILKQNPAIVGGLDEPRWNIAAGIWYDRKNYLAWTADRTPEDQLKFMFGSYNAGRSNILRAQRIALAEGMAGTSWVSIERCLPQVTGRHSRETLTYVSRIFEIKEVLR